MSKVKTLWRSIAVYGGVTYRGDSFGVSRNIFDEVDSCTVD